MGLIGAFYVAGAVSGALFFGHLTDRWGRKKLFMITLAVYLLATVATAFSWNALSFFVFRFFAGAGIGGECSAINSGIDELIPARVRGWVDLAINGSWWLGTAAGALISIPLLNPAYFSIDLGWRLAFAPGAVLGIGFLIAAGWLLVAAVVTWLLAVDAEQKPLEEVAEPLSAAGNADETGEAEAADEPTHRERREVGGYPVRAGAHWSPRYSFHGVDDPLEGQIAAIERVAAEADRPLPERELLARTNSRHWRPGVGRRALRRAVNEGRISRDGSGYVAPAPLISRRRARRSGATSARRSGRGQSRRLRRPPR